MRTQRRDPYTEYVKMCVRTQQREGGLSVDPEHFPPIPIDDDDAGMCTLDD